MNKRITIARTITLAFSVDAEAWARDSGVPVEQAAEDFRRYLDPHMIAEHVREGMAALRDADGQVVAC